MAQITSTTDTNWIGNPNFESSSTVGWSVAGGVLTVYAGDSYGGSVCGQFISSTTNGTANYQLTGMTVGVQYVAQARVKATAGQIVFMSFAGSTSGSGYSAFTASGGWDLLTSGTVTSTDVSFAVQVGVMNAGQTILIDEVMLEQAPTAGTYFDGNSGNGYHWNGSTDLSTSFYRNFEVVSATNYQIPDYGVLISWTRAINPNYHFFTIGTSTIGGPDFIAGTSTYPTLYNQYQYSEYSTYLLSFSVARNIGQYPYGAFGAQLSMSLDNSDFLFLPGYDPTIGSYIINGRPVTIQLGYNGELINLFSGTSTKPMNDIQNRTLQLNGFDGMDYLNSFKSKGAGPVAAASNGCYANLPADQIIGDLLAEAGFSPTQYVAEQSLQQPIGYLAPAGYVSNDATGDQGSIGTIISDICEAEQGLFFFDENGIAHFWNREHIPTNDTIQWSFAYKSIENYQTEDTPIINNVQVIAHPRQVQAKQNIWQLTDAQPIPVASTTQTVTNYVINPNFIVHSGGTFQSSISVNVADSTTTGEMVIAYSDPTISLLRINVADPTVTTETLTVNRVLAANKPAVVDSTQTSESYAIKIGTGSAVWNSYSVNVTDNSQTSEAVSTLTNNSRYVIIMGENSTTAENVRVILNNAGKLNVADSAVTYESVTINTVTDTGWGTANATLAPGTGDGPSGITANYGAVATQGSSLSYIYQNITCSPSTQYVVQAYAKATSGTHLTLQVVQGANVVASTTFQADGNWDLLQIAPFNSSPTFSSFQVQLSTDLPDNVRVAAVMVQQGVGALTTYFDGSTAATSSYLFSWSGTANQSTSIGTPVGSFTIEADFQDPDGSLPVTSVDAPVYNNANLSSSFLTNLNSDGTGITGAGSVTLQSTTLNGSTYTMTFINTYSQPIYVTQCTLYGTPAKIAYSINQEYTDPTSVVLYGTNPTNNGQVLQIQNDLIQNPSTALSNAYELVNDYAHPYTRLVADVFPAFHLQIGDQVEATIDDTSQTLNYTIVGITAGVATDGKPTQNLELEVKQNIHYFTINTSVVGGTDQIAP